MIITDVRDFCSRNNLVYVFGIKVDNCVYFCVVDSESSLYTMYKMCNGCAEEYLANLSLLQVKFQKEALLGIGGQLIERV